MGESKQSRKENNNRNQVDKYTHIVNLAADAIIIGNSKGEIIESNEKMFELSGYRINDLLNKHITLIFSPETLKEKPLNFDIINQGIPILSEREMVKKDGSTIYIEMHTSKINDEYVSIIRDITQRKKYINQLIESESKFKSLTETSSAAIFIHRKKFIYTNKAFHDLSEFNFNELVNIDFWEIIHPDFLELAKHRAFRRLKGEDVIDNYEIQIITKSNKIKWVNLSVKRIIYNGEPALIGTAIDVSARKETELTIKKTNQQIKESEYKFRQYIDQNTAAMMAIDPVSQRIEFANHAATTMYGYSKEELLNMQISKIQTISREEIAEKMKQALQNKSTEYQFKHKTKNNKIIDVLVNASSVKINKKITLVILIRDITKELRIKNDLINSHNSYRNILDSISEMIYIQDKEGVFKFVNKASVKKYGYRIRDFIGRKPDFLSAPNKNNLEEIMEKTKLAYEGSIERFNFWGLKKNGEIFPKEVILSSGFFFGEKVVIAVSRDITEQNRITLELIDAKEKAEESNRLKTAFLANISHELRTPMNAISGFSTLLKDNSLSSEEKKEYSEAISISTNHLLNLINDLIDISRLQAKLITVENSTLYLNKLLSSIIEDFKINLKDLDKNEKVNIISTFEFADGEDLIITDVKRLKQILRHTIDNAIKFTKTGNIYISYTLKDDFLVFEILDEGIGIPFDKQNNIFKQFSHADPTINREYGGIGIGLFISKACVELLKGEIFCTSKENSGTKIAFTIPYTKAD